MSRNVSKDKVQQANFILKVLECQHSVSFSVNEPQRDWEYHLNFKTDRAICESIAPSDKLGVRFEVGMAYDSRPLVTVLDVEKAANDDLWNKNFPNFEAKDKARNQLMKEYQPKGIGSLESHKGVMKANVLLPPDVWMANHILLCSGKPCFISLSGFREYRQRHHIVKWMAVSTEPEE